MRILRAAAVAIAAFAFSHASAADLRIGLAATPTSMDPQFYVVGPNSAMARNIFDGLVNQDERQQLKPALATAWTLIDDTTWEFKLRRGVVFHDGSPLTSADIVASIARVPLASRNSPSSFMPYVEEIAKVEPIDDLTVRIRTKAPAPLLLNNLSRIAILPAAMLERPTADLNSGKGVVGTGPLKFVSWTPDNQIVLARNDKYWGPKAAWDKVTFRVIADSGARVAALKAGDVDMIEGVPTSDIKNIESDSKLKIVTVASNRVMYLHMDQSRDISPFAAGDDGKNPLLKPEVRHAISLSINRQAIVDRIMDGQGESAGQLVPKGYFGWSPAIGVDGYDPNKAKELLAAGGYPNGFKLTFHASNDRYPNDSKVAQAIGQMLNRIGVKASIDVMPGSVYFSRASKLEFSFIMGGAAVETGEAASVLGPLLATYSPTTGQGNRGRYSNPAFDKALSGALSTIDEAAREKLLQSAMEIGMKDHGVIPLFFLGASWAMRSGLSYGGRTDGYTLAADVRNAQ
ncbi:ABC transporter substrate-binding protein [Terrarubrum flagellatum]|uniref:ABC transporter substrate-binding protein n=1 Tax=Terrirubrum flagellatum TaxID=2895980 RepID=UPI0031454510